MSSTEESENNLTELTEAELYKAWEIIAANNLEFFLEYESDGAWMTARHLHILCEKLMAAEQAVREQEGYRLMVFMPPRHGKSETSTKKFPAWYVGRNPNHEIIITSYSEDLAVDHSAIARETFTRMAPKLWDHRISRRSQAGGKWGVEGFRGGIKAAGVGGPITGRGAHVAIIDDPFKNWEEANSLTIREKVWNWYRSTLRTRLAPGGAIILIMTRWHEDDLAGRLLKAAETDGEHWDVLNLAAEAEENDPLGRRPGEWLWPERFSATEYRNTKKAIGSFLWASLYQQHPSPMEGGIWKRQWVTNFWTQKPAHFDEIIQSWDMAFKDTKASAYVCGQVWGRKGADKYLLDQVRDKMDYVETKKAFRAFSAKWPTSVKLIEDKANGPAIMSDLKHEISGIIAFEPGGSKEERAHAVAGDWEAGNVYIPDPSLAPWVNDFIEECVAFPNSTYKDQVDTASQALLRLRTVTKTIPSPVGVGQSYWRGK